MANVTVGINSKFDAKGVDDSKRAFEGLKNSLTSISTMARGLFNLSVINKARDAVMGITRGSLDAYRANQSAYQKLSSSILTNNNRLEGSFKRITDFTDAISSNSLFGGDVLTNQAALLASLGLSETQMQNTLQAAVDLSTAGIGSLDSNAKDLAETLTGKVSGGLLKCIPELRTLNTEQLKAGKAVEIVNQKYKDFAKTIKENTLEGKENRFESAIGTIQHGIGSAWAGMKMSLLDEINPVLESLGTWVVDNAPKIGATLISYVQTIGDIISNIRTNFDTLKKPETWNDFFSHANSLATSFVNYLAGALKDTFTNAIEIFKWLLGNVDILKILWTPFIKMLGNLSQGERIKNRKSLYYKDLRYQIFLSCTLLSHYVATN
jgi:hypothetical protein